MEVRWKLVGEAAEVVLLDEIHTEDWGRPAPELAEHSSRHMVGSYRHRLEEQAAHFRHVCSTS